MYEIAEKNIDEIKKSSSLEPLGHFKRGTKHPWVKCIQVCTNEGLRSFPRGDNYEIVNID